MQPYPVKPLAIALAVTILAGLCIAPTRAFSQTATTHAKGTLGAQPPQVSPLLAHSVTGMVGQFFYDAGGDLPYAMANIRYTRSLGRYVFGEGGLGYAHLKTGAARSDGSDFRYVATPILLVDVGIFTQFALGPIAPFVGLTASAFRRAGSGRLDTVTGVGTGAAGGVRVRVARALFLRAEFNVRADYEGALDLLNATQTVGLGYAF